MLLENAGYACTRAAASLGAFEVVGIGPTDVVLVESKTHDWPGSAETEHYASDRRHASEFCKDRFEPRAKASFEKNAPANWLWYRAGIRALLSYKPLATAKLDSIGNELAANFAAHRPANAKQISTINSSLRVLS